VDSRACGPGRTANADHVVSEYQCPRRGEGVARRPKAQGRRDSDMSAGERPTGSKRPTISPAIVRISNVEPDWVNDALFASESFIGPIVDPACGLGRIVSAAIRAGHHPHGTDIVKRSPMCDHAADFIDDRPHGVANIVSNPPYGRAQEFAALALRTAARKVALLVPSGFLFGRERSRWLEQTPLRKVWIIVPRPSMPPGELIVAGMKPGGGRVDYCWLVWERGYEGEPVIGWLRKAK
jgi:hypothetical protein